MTDEITPTIEEEAAVETPVVNEQMSEEAQLLERLKAAGMTKPEQVDGAIRNAQRTYDLQSERDQLANQLRTQEQRMADLEKKFSEPSTETDDYGQPVDLDGAIAKGVNRVLDERDKRAFQNQERMMSTWNTISKHKDFKLVEEVWNEKMKDPNFVYGVQSGRVNPVEVFQDVVIDFHKGLALRAANTIETLTKGVPPAIHVEGGDARTPDMPPPTDESEHTKTITTITERADSGKLLSEEDELALIQASLSKGE
jgi:hypothetical protein